MPDTIKAYIEASDNASDYADSQAESVEQQAREDIDDLFINVDNRDAELWDSWGVNSELVLADYDTVEVDERDLDWVLGLAGLSAAATTQFFLENPDPLMLNAVSYREQVLDPFNMTREQLVIAGKRGVELEATKKFAKLRAEYVAEMEFLRGHSNAILYENLLDFKAIRPIEHAITDATGYVARMTDYVPGSTQFRGEVAKLIDTNAKGRIKQMNRRAVERIHAYREANGKGSTLMVWLVEGGPSTCDYCLDNAGVVDTYENWILYGLPGASVCKGGDRCRCHLAAA